MKRRYTRQRIRMTEAAAMAIVLCFTGGFGYKYLLSPVISSDSAAVKNNITYQEIDDKVIEGDIIDRSGNIIMGYASAGSSSYANYPENVSYSYLLGYYTLSAGRENMYGLRGNLKEYSLFTLDEANKGAAVRLTTDSGLQDYAYSLLGDGEGSIIVLDNETADVLCLASRSTITYNVNDLESFITSDVEGSQYRRGTYENDPPGSTFKVVTAAAALEKAADEGLDESWFAFHDTGTYTPEGSDYVITNYNSIAWGDVNLETAMNNSVNCYFADLGIKTGASKLKKTAEKFMLGKDIEIPFLTTIKSSMSFEDTEPITVAQTAFGQGDTEITPFHLALIAQAVANDGKMMQPHIVESIKSGSLPLYQKVNRRLSRSTDEETAETLKEILHSTAEGYGLYENTYGYVCAKTGTAECANDRIHTYMIGFTEKYSFCISRNNGHASSDLYGTAQYLVSYLNQMED